MATFYTYTSVNGRVLRFSVLTASGERKQPTSYSLSLRDLIRFREGVLDEIVTWKSMNRRGITWNWVFFIHAATTRTGTRNFWVPKWLPNLFCDTSLSLRVFFFLSIYPRASSRSLMALATYDEPIFVYSFELRRHFHLFNHPWDKSYDFEGRWVFFRKILNEAWIDRGRK